jgi:hypothetical protein
VLLAVEAVWDAFDADDAPEPPNSDCDADEQVFLAI